MSREFNEISFGITAGFDLSDRGVRFKFLGPGKRSLSLSGGTTRVSMTREWMEAARKEAKELPAFGYKADVTIEEQSHLLEKSDGSGQ